MKLPLLATLLTVGVVSAYDPDAAMTALFYSKTSYCAEADIQSWTCLPCQHSTVQGAVSTQVFTEDSTGGQNFVTYQPSTQTIVVAFRGSQNIQNWIENLSIVKDAWEQSTCSGCEVHSGFADMWTTFQSGMLAKVDSLKNTYPVQSILVTGHSLGGALATLAALDLRTKYGTMVQLINFGSPRVGNTAFYNKIKSLFSDTDVRVVHNHDIVPHWPKAITYSGYHHIEKEVWYTSATAYNVCNDSGEDPNCSNSVTGDSIDDHLAYLGQSTSCNNADAANLAVLKGHISEDNLDFFDQFEKIVLDCNVTGFMKHYAKGYGHQFKQRQMEFENQSFVKGVIKCVQQTLFNKVENYVEYPRCDDLMEWGLESFKTCIVNPGNGVTLDQLSSSDKAKIADIIKGDLQETLKLTFPQLEEVYLIQ